MRRAQSLRVGLGARRCCFTSKRKLPHPFEIALCMNIAIQSRGTLVLRYKTRRPGYATERCQSWQYCQSWQRPRDTDGVVPMQASSCDTNIHQRGSTATERCTSIGSVQFQEICMPPISAPSSYQHTSTVMTHLPTRSRKHDCCDSANKYEYTHTHKRTWTIPHPPTHTHMRAQPKFTRCATEPPDHRGPDEARRKMRDCIGLSTRSILPYSL